MEKRVKTLLARVQRIIDIARVEPLACMLIFAYSLHNPVRPRAQLEKLTATYSDEYYQMSSEDGETYMQQQMVLWGNLNTAVFLPISIFTIAFLGAWGDVKGRQLNIMLSLTCLIIWLVSMLLVWSDSVGWPLWTSLVFAAIEALFGTFALSWISFYAYIADTVTHREHLTLRYTLMEVINSVSAFAGSFIAGLLAVRVSPVNWTLMVECIMLICFVYTMARVPQVPQTLLAKARQGSSDVTIRGPEDSSIEPSTASTKFTLGDFRQLMSDRVKLTKAAFHTYTKPRAGHKRGMLLGITLVWFVGTIASMQAQDLVSLYTLRKKFNWTATEFGYYSAVEAITSIFGLAIGMTVLKNYLKMRDTTIMVIGQASHTLSILPWIFADHSWQLYLKPIIGVLAKASLPATYAFFTRLVEADEIGKALTVNTISGSIAAVVEEFGVNQIYKYTVGSFPELIWILTAAMFALCFCILVYVHYLAVTEHIEDDEPPAQTPSTVELLQN